MALDRRASADGPTPGSSADDVPEADPYDVARTICLQQLTSSPKTRGQLATVLRRRGIDDDVAAAVLDRLNEVSLVDDASFSENYVRTRHASSGKAGRALAYELRGKGVEEAVIAEALDALSADDEAATARSLRRQEARVHTAVRRRGAHPPAGGDARAQGLLGRPCDAGRP